MHKRLQFIHVGKCGGSTITSLLKASELVESQYQSVFISHIEGVSIDSDCDYLICMRNPISRAISAFEWRKKLVLVDSLLNQKDRFFGEASALSAYNSFNEFANHLYDKNGHLCQDVARHFSMIHHLRESISFYIKPLLPVLRAENVLGVICQETLASDCARILEVDASSVYVRQNNLSSPDSFDLDRSAIRNLKRYLSDDYQCISAMWNLGLIDDQQFMLLMLGSQPKFA